MNPTHWQTKNQGNLSAFSIPEDATVHWTLATILGLTALGLWRLTVWSRMLASGVLVLSIFLWWALCTPMPSEGWHSILEPIFGEFLPVWGYFFFIYVPESVFPIVHDLHTGLIA